MPSIDPTPNPSPHDSNEQPDAQPIPPPIIFSYTRAQAVADGVLIDVTAKEAGFVLPVAVTAAVWAEYIKVPDGVEGQDEAGRLWDLLTMLRSAIRRDASGGPELLFQLHERNDNAEGESPLVTLKAMCGPDDDLSPCITVLLPEEDGAAPSRRPSMSGRTTQPTATAIHDSWNSRHVCREMSRTCDPY